MPTNFPASLDDNSSLPNPGALNAPNVVSHSAQHTNANDSIKAIEGKLGTGVSAPSSGKLLISTATGVSSWSKDAPSGTIVGTTDAQTLTNKIINGATLNNPIIVNPNISADLITEFTAGNGVSVGGVNLKNGSIATNNSVPSNALAANAVSQILLEVAETTNIHNNTPITANTWTDVVGNKTFTVTSSSSIIGVSIMAVVQLGGAALSSTSSRIVIDSAGTPIIRKIGGCNVQVANQFANPFAAVGSVLLTGLSPGSHTIKSQVLSSNSGSLYLRPALIPDTEFYTTQIFELKK